MKGQETDTIVTAFGIDNEELTFGRDPGCGVRLYYRDINLVHCKITFTDRKAFLVVLGSSGLLVDGCRIYPNGTPGGQPTTIPLLNDSEIEIHGKRFRFSYPPKELRAALLATPARNNRRLRLSMINSAQVFSPRPSKDPRENLRILRSPMKNAFRSPGKPSTLSRSPITSAHQDEDDNDDEEPEIVLVDGNHPRVVEEDKDLVILEDVEAPEPQPVVQVQPPKTPQRRRSQSLHRAVLIRSAQRRVIEHEKQRQQEEEEREEEMEVLDTIASDDISGEEDTFAQVQLDHDDQEDYPPSDEETDSDEEEAPEESNQERRKSLWRKSFEKLWPFRSTSPTDEQVAKDKEAEQEEPEESSEEEDEENEAQDQPEALPSLPQPTPIRRPLGTFMTPQVGQKLGPFDRGQSIDPSARGRLGGGPPVRYSLGGEARRVSSGSAWRVKDLVVPLKSETSELTVQPNALSGASRQSQIPEQPQASPVRSRSGVSAEERRAIQERRRSALRDVDSHTYFAGGIPGMSPSKGSASPAKAGSNDANNPFRSVSPTKMASIPPVKDIDRRLSMDEEDEKLDTRSLLERMKETVEGMKKRRSTIGLPPSSPMKPSHDVNPFDDSAHQNAEDDHDADKENDENAMDVDVDMDVDPEPLMLLRSLSKIPSEARSIEGTVQDSTADDVPVISSIVEIAAETSPEQSQDEVVEPLVDSSLPKPPEGRSRTRSRSPQPPSEQAREPVRPTIARRTCKATVEPEDAPETAGVQAPRRNTRKPTRLADQEEPAAPTATTQTRRARKPFTEPEEPQPSRQGRKTPIIGEEPAPAPKRNLRKTSVKEEKDDGAEPQAPGLRRGRIPRAPAASDVEKEASRSAKAPAKRTTSRARVMRSTRLRMTRLKTPPPPKAVAKARKPRTTVKQEEPSTEVLKTSTRSRAAAATKTPAATKGRPRKTPATAPAATQVDLDKENAPGESTSSLGDVDEGVVVKVRTTRKMRTVPVKQEPQEASTTAQPKARAMRTARVRTRTT
ncbi:hypothetical protein NP233_g260 [Leucocoprinus birnbaumii]|uniref:FHA domain-containing protein n=1 Tax=Leucocoprinus birnbaumii TaxID=56174 RepID=A0AAD5W4I8_9AGAR|nr:hypothetical protein NP233_g260 [Leucocoprinus birnbaumii]